LLVAGAGATFAWVRSLGKGSAQQPGSGASLSGGPVLPGAGGQLRLQVVQAQIHGAHARYECRDGEDHIGHWDDVHDYLTWACRVGHAGRYRVELTFSCNPREAGSTYVISVGGEQVSGKVESTGHWAQYKTHTVGDLYLGAGNQTLTLCATEMPRRAVMHVREVVLTPVP
jgi:hypothetical protein